jgi:hypothetical protein
MLSPPRPRFFAVLLSALACAFVLSLATPSRADGVLSADLDAALSPDGPRGVDTGWGVGGRLGHRWRLLLIDLTPEFGFHYTTFGGSSDLTAWNASAGGRLGVNFILEPSVFAHAGLGHYGYDIAGKDYTQTALGYDFGFALDLTAIPIIDIGAHVAWMGVSGDEEMDSLGWVAVGGHVGIHIPGM